MQTTPEMEVSEGGITEAQGAEEMLKRWGAKEEAPAPEEEEAEEPAEQSQDDEPQDESESEDEGQSDDVEIDVGGEKFKLPPVIAAEAKRIESKVKEIEAGATRKFQEAADLRRVAESQIEAAKQLQKVSSEQADLIADHRLVTRQLEQLEKVDWNSLVTNDPVEATRLNVQFNQLNAAKARIEQAYQSALQKSQGVQSQIDGAKLERLNEYAQKNVKGWSQEYSETLLNFSVKQLGLDADFVRQNISEALIKGLDLAYKGWKVQSTDPKAKMVQTGKTLKPGGNAGVKTNAMMTADKASSKLKQSGKVEDAVAAILARSSVKRR
jgi:hypothetical protein